MMFWPTITDSQLSTGKRSASSTEDSAVTAEELDLLAQAVGQRHIAAVLPEGAGALGMAVVHQQEIAHAAELGLEHPVVALDVRGGEVAVRKELEQHGDAALDEVDRGGLQRLQKPRRQPERDDVPAPGRLAPPGPEAQRRPARSVRGRPGCRAAAHARGRRRRNCRCRCIRCRRDAAVESAIATRHRGRSRGYTGSAQRHGRCARSWPDHRAATRLQSS